MSGNVQSSLAPKGGLYKPVKAGFSNNTLGAGSDPFNQKSNLFALGPTVGANGLKSNQQANAAGVGGGIVAQDNATRARGLLAGNANSQNNSQTGSSASGSSSTVTPPVTPTDPYNQSGKTLTDISTGAGGAGSGTGAYQAWLDRQANNPTPAQTSINTLQGISQNQTPEVVAAQKRFTDFSNANPLLQGNIENQTNIAGELARGSGRAIANTLSGTEQALQNNLQSALSGEGQQITAGQDAGQLGLLGQSQQLGAQEAGAGLGLTQQGQQINAAQNAGSLTKPENVPYYTSPTTGSVVGGGTIEDAISRQGTYAGLSSNAQDYVQNGAKIKGAQNQLNNLSTFVTSTGVNPLKVNLGNQGIQGLQNQMSSSEYNTFYNSIDILGKSLGIDLISQLKTNQGQSAMTTIQNAITQANANNEALKGGSKNGGGNYTGGYVKTAAGNLPTDY